ncbi:pyridoxal 5'-phosphate synthase [Catellatospora bangladeshensis]|uniref:Pyridoxamine 5'-phosphate oxidase n=1 Tax=Catellatospora bangladeshensis TaxID=310355 RepID=A0A8J3JBX6_9ACTN|nr:pyridoxal 5'-phosphate synthase [Catellatospora bangladeshensis]GIF81441.1 pyridoxamine 5'-phosphate oxidase [Catellatospora bangladeshensis]
MRDLLRNLPVFDRPLPAFDPGAAPPDPIDLLEGWLREAIAAGVSEPHAMTLATAGPERLPDLRVLILKDLDAEGLYFASESISAKAGQLGANPQAALGFYWREQGRQIRVRGPVQPAGPEVSAQDFLARPLSSRAASLIGRQSSVLHDPADLTEALAEAQARLEADPHLVAEHHTVYLLKPMSVEFWQGDAQRRHIRLRYRRTEDGWRTERLWP